MPALYISAVPAQGWTARKHSELLFIVMCKRLRVSVYLPSSDISFQAQACHL